MEPMRYGGRRVRSLSRRSRSNPTCTRHCTTGASRFRIKLKPRGGDGADALWRQAGEKFEQALKIKPDLHEALYNWGVALSDQAKTKRGGWSRCVMAAGG